MNHHFRAALTHEAVAAVDLSAVQTLAALPPDIAGAVSQLRGADLVPYYDFASNLLYSSLNSHVADAECVSMAMRLALKLLAESAPLPTACERFTRLVKQAATLCMGPEKAAEHPICKNLEAQLRASAHEDIAAICLHMPLSLESTPGMRECVLQCLRAVPPTTAWRESVVTSVDTAAASNPAAFAPVVEVLREAFPERAQQQ